MRFPDPELYIPHGTIFVNSDQKQRKTVTKTVAAAFFVFEKVAAIDSGISNVLYSGLRVEKDETTWQPRGIGAATEKGNLFASQWTSTC
jgi:hypothetical protein